MKKMFKTLPLVAAILFATSCSKDDNNEVAEPAAKTVTVKMTVGYNSQSLSKVLVTEPSEGNVYTQTFQDGDVIEFSGDASGSVTLNSSNIEDEGEVASFEATLTLAAGVEPGEALLLTAELKNSVYAFLTSEVPNATDNLDYLFATYGYWKGDFVYSNGTDADEHVTLQQQNAFVKMPATLSSEDVRVYVMLSEDDGMLLEAGMYYAVKSGTVIKISNGTKTFKHTVESGDVYSVVEPKEFNE